MIVDDSADVRDLFVVLAELNGFIVETARNGKEALEKLAQLNADPSIVFVDLNMPVMGGAEFVRRLKETGLASTSRIVIFSGREKETVPNLDASLMWLAKPFELSDVLKVINLPNLH
ncbi:MAG: response regulator [Bdellovibrionales bacterium]